MSTENKPLIKKIFQFKPKYLYFLRFKNIIISIPYYSKRIYFYKLNESYESLEKDFYIKFRPGDKRFYYWKLYFTKNKQIFLIGYNNKAKISQLDELGIYLLNIEEKSIIQKAYFTYCLFVENKKIDALYIYNKKSIIIYDFMTNTSKEKIINVNIRHSSGGKLFLIGDNLILTFGETVYKWDWGFTHSFIMDKDCEIIKEKNIHIPFWFDVENIDFLENSFQLISNNKYFINAIVYSDFTSIKFAEINLKDNENLLNKKDEELKNIIIAHDIKIPGERNISSNMNNLNISLHPLNDKKLIINFNDNDFYVLDIQNMQIITKMKINLQLNKLIKETNYFDSFNDKILFFKANKKNDCYKIYYTNYNEILYITNK